MLYLAGYIEKFGTGTLMMIRESRVHALPEPLFAQQAGEFGATIGRDWVTEEVLARLPLNERQHRAITQVKTAGRITNREYQELVRVISRTAARDLRDLEGKGLLRRIGTTGRGAYYVLAPEQDKNRTNETSPGSGTGPSARGTGRKRDKRDRAGSPAGKAARPREPRRSRRIPGRNGRGR